LIVRYRGWLATVAAFGVVVLSCGDPTSSDQDPNKAALVVVTPASRALAAIGATQQFTAIALNTAGDTLSGKTFAWTSSDSTVVRVDAATGLATSVSNGAADVTATVDGKAGSATVTVAQVITSVFVDAARDILIIVGDTVTFSAVGNDSRGNEVAGTTPTWASSFPAVASIDVAGFATAVGSGTTNISATVDGVTGNRLLLVRPTPVAVLDMPDSVAAGGQVQVSLRLLTEGITNTTGAFAATVTWDPAVLQLDTGAAAAVPYFVSNSDNVQGWARFVVSEPQGIGGNFSAAVLTFDAVGVSGASTTVEVTVDRLISAESFRDFGSEAVGDNRVLVVR
jgi:hypothetical protein